MNTFEHYILFF